MHMLSTGQLLALREDAKTKTVCWRVQGAQVGFCSPGRGCVGACPMITPDPHFLRNGSDPLRDCYNHFTYLKAESLRGTPSVR